MTERLETPSQWPIKTQIKVMVVCNGVKERFTQLQVTALFKYFYHYFPEYIFQFLVSPK